MPYFNLLLVFIRMLLPSTRRSVTVNTQKSSERATCAFREVLFASV